MPYVRTDDRVRLYYEEHGPTDPDATGSPLVLAYGIGGNADLWDVNIPALAARHRLVLWEPRGHARSDSPEDPARYSFARWVLDLKAVLDGLRLRTAHVGGLSLGAGIDRSRSPSSAAWTRWPSSRWPRTRTSPRGWRWIPPPRTSSTRTTGASRRSAMRTRCARCSRWITSPIGSRASVCPCC
ncbi:MAG: hypothetical protein DME02_08415 [Candidatus Rokuibacteriota bacterium]|nr:MAG: hypothetical protein DME02_08415 [Candidatus Rokubacteria bacterium]